MSEHTAGADVGTADGTGHAKPTSSELLVVTGMSGAGRSTAANALEDLGWYVVDNLPPQMLHTLADLVSRTPQALPKLAVVIDVRGKVDYSDYVLVMSGRSDRQVNALGRHIEEELKAKHNARCLGVEGMPSGTWLLMDFGDVIVHIFHEDTRGYYDLETLWIDAARVTTSATASDA